MVLVTGHEGKGLIPQVADSQVGVDHKVNNDSANLPFAPASLAQVLKLCCLLTRSLCLRVNCIAPLAVIGQVNQNLLRGRKAWFTGRLELPCDWDT